MLYVYELIINQLLHSAKDRSILSLVCLQYKALRAYLYYRRIKQKYDIDIELLEKSRFISADGDRFIFLINYYKLFDLLKTDPYNAIVVFDVNNDIDKHYLIDTFKNRAVSILKCYLSENGRWLAYVKKDNDTRAKFMIADKVSHNKLDGSNLSIFINSSSLPSDQYFVNPGNRYKDLILYSCNEEEYYINDDKERHTNNRKAVSIMKFINEGD